MRAFSSRKLNMDEIPRDRALVKYGNCMKTLPRRDEDTDATDETDFFAQEQNINPDQRYRARRNYTSYVLSGAMLTAAGFFASITKWDAIGRWLAGGDCTEVRSVSPTVTLRYTLEDFLPGNSFGNGMGNGRGNGYGNGNGNGNMGSNNGVYGSDFIQRTTLDLNCGAAQVSCSSYRAVVCSNIGGIVEGSIERTAFDYGSKVCKGTIVELNGVCTVECVILGGKDNGARY